MNKVAISNKLLLRKITEPSLKSSDQATLFISIVAIELFSKATGDGESKPKDQSQNIGKRDLGRNAVVNSIYHLLELEGGNFYPSSSAKQTRPGLIDYPRYQVTCIFKEPYKRSCVLLQGQGMTRNVHDDYKYNLL